MSRQPLTRAGAGHLVAIDPDLAGLEWLKASLEGVFAGVPLGRWYPELADCLLVAVTEQRTREEIDRLAAILGGAG